MTKMFIKLICLKFLEYVMFNTYIFWLLFCCYFDCYYYYVHVLIKDPMEEKRYCANTAEMGYTPYFELNFIMYYVLLFYGNKNKQTNTFAYRHDKAMYAQRSWKLGCMYA